MKHAMTDGLQMVKRARSCCQLDSFEVSDDIAVSDAPIFLLSRLVGLAPLSAFNSGKTHTLRWSVLLNLYSYAIVITAVVLGIVGMLSDLWAGETNSVRMKTALGKVVTIGDITSVFIIASIGVLGAPFRIPAISRFYRKLSQVDQVLTMTDSMQARNRSITCTVVIMSYITLVLSFDLYAWIRFASYQSDGDFVIRNYLPFYCCYYVVFALELQFGQAASNLKRRFKRLNDYLDISKIEKLQSADESSRTRSWKSLGNDCPVHNFQTKDLGSVIDLLSRNKKITDAVLHKSTTDENLLACNSTEYIARLCELHGKLCEAVLALNDGFGTSLLVILLSCLLHLIETPYFLLIEITGRKDTLFLALQICWICIHGLRLLIVVEPCSDSSNEAKNTNVHVCSLLCLPNLDRSLRKQLEIFSLQLIHRPVEFSACGLCKLDRPLISAIAGAVTTYLVILFQFNN